MKDDRSTRVYNALFRPESIVVVGGSDNPGKPGGKVLANIAGHRYTGTLWVVNPGSTPVMGLPTFASVMDLPGIPELAIVAIPAALVGEALDQLGSRGTKAVIILSAGFGEKSAEGREEEMRLLAIAQKTGMTVIGPNCSGFMTPHYSGKFAGIIPRLRPRSIDFISGSGATVDLVMEQAVLRGLSFSNVVNVGNSIQTGVEDLLALYDDNYGADGSPVLMLYLESLGKPGLLLDSARSLTGKGCAIVGIKAGVSIAGARAAASHTGAMATDDKVVQALFDKAGIIRVESKMEMIDVACALLGTGGRLKGNRVCVITDAGGPGVMITDELERQGLCLPVPGEKTQARLRGILPPESSVTNPVDCLPSRTAEQARRILETIQQEEGDAVDAIAIQVANPGMSHNRLIYREVADAMRTSSIPVLPVLTSVSTCTDLIREFTDDGNFCFQDEVNLARALGKVFRRPLIHEAGASGGLPDYDREGIGAVLEGCRGPLAPAAVWQVLGKAGFALPVQVAALSVGEAARACEKIGFPLAMKVMGPLHKSDLQGVRLDVEDAGAAVHAFGELMSIDGAEGVLLQQMVKGTEVIMGAGRAAGLGHLVMFGLGGIYTEVLRDVVFALAPLAGQECLEMIRSVRGYSILEGLRGRKSVSIEHLADMLGRLGRLVCDFPAVSEIDLNPVKGYGEHLFVVDARIIMDVSTP